MTQEIEYIRLPRLDQLLTVSVAITQKEYDSIHVLWTGERVQAEATRDEPLGTMLVEIEELADAPHAECVHRVRVEDMRFAIVFHLPNPIGSVPATIANVPGGFVIRSALCSSRRELSNAYFLAKFCFDTAENEHSEVCHGRLRELKN